jgi:hypothetical protein
LLHIEVTDEPCYLKTQYGSYNLPAGASTVPIIIDFDGCIPYDTLQVSASSSLQVASASSNLQVTALQDTISYASIETRRKVSPLVRDDSVVSFTVSSKPTQTAGETYFETLLFRYLLTFSLNGHNARSYILPSPVEILTLASTT